MILGVCRVGDYSEVVMKYIAFFIATLTASSAIAADAAHQPAFDPMLVEQLAKARTIAMLCRPSDGAVLNRAFWAPRLATVPARRRAAFSALVREQSNAMIASVQPAEAVPLWCDDQLDLLVDAYGYALPGSANPGPVCWSDPLGLSGCPGIGYDDPFAGLEGVVDGY